MRDWENIRKLAEKSRDPFSPDGYVRNFRLAGDAWEFFRWLEQLGYTNICFRQLDEHVYSIRWTPEREEIGG